MVKAYFETLAQNYFGSLYEKVRKILFSGENVCISAIPGFGYKTIFNFLYYYLQKEKAFDLIEVYDLADDESKHNLVFNDNKTRLIIFRNFEKLKDPKEKLNYFESVRRPNPKKLVYLVFTNHSPLMSPSDYYAQSTVFFSEIIYIKPFDLRQTIKMIKTLEDFYGWKISEKLYKKIYLLSGGIPRLIKYITKKINEENTPTDNITQFLSSPQIIFQLEILTNLLFEMEKNTLMYIQLLGSNGKIKSKLLRAYFKNYQAGALNKIFPNLSTTEIKILSYLLSQTGNLLSLDKLADLLKITEDNYSLWALYKMISRLKQKVKGYYKIRAFKSKGYLIEPMVTISG